MKQVLLHNLIPGMVTAKDIYANNLLLTPKGTPLTESMISAFILHSLLSVPIEEEQITIEKPIKPLTSVEPKESTSNIKHTEEFKVFKQKFENITEFLQDNINELVLSETPIDAAKLIAQTESMIANGMTNLGLFDMLHHMRDYDDSTYAHCVNVGLICNSFGRWLAFSEEEIELLTLAGLLHDVGKLQIPDVILKKPDRLTPAEFDIIKQHPFKGYQILRKQNLDPRIAQAALLHHERCDGSGYPMGFESKNIIDFAKIVAIADVYDAMTSSRCYRDAICPFKAIAEIESEGISKYDPKFFLLFLEHVLNTYINCEVKLSDGNVGKVIYIHKQNLSRPVVKIGSQCVDLAEHEELNIDEIL